MSSDATPDAMVPPIRSIPAHTFVNVEGNSFCGECGAGDAHPIHITPEEEYKTPVPSTYADLPKELSRMLHLVMDAVDEQPQSLRGPESLLHKASVLAWVSMARSLQQIADALERWVP